MSSTHTYPKLRDVMERIQKRKKLQDLATTPVDSTISNQKSTIPNQSLAQTPVYEFCSISTFCYFPNETNAITNQKIDPQLPIQKFIFHNNLSYIKPKRSHKNLKRKYITKSPIKNFKIIQSKKLKK